MLKPSTIKMWIESALPHATAEVDGDGHHFTAVIICEDFQGKLPIARHRMVYAALGEHMKSDIHALSMDTLTPEEHKVR